MYVIDVTDTVSDAVHVPVTITSSLITFSTFPEYKIGEHFVRMPYLHTHTHTHTQNGFFPLFLASHEGHDKIVEMLLQAGATVDLQNKVKDCYYDSTLFIRLL